MKKFDTKIIGTAAVALIVGAGLGYVLPHGGSAGPGPLTQSGAFNRGALMTRGGGGNFLSGTIAKQDSGSITINTRDGSSHLVLLTPATTVSKSTTGTVSDLSVGKDVIVSGTTNSDGSVSATLVQLRPAGVNGPMIPAPGPGAQ
jgi:hypothetical protein